MLKRCGILLALLTVLALLITCSLSPPDGYQPPEGGGTLPGMGSVRLNFSDSILRTMLPEDIYISDFFEFELIFTDTAGTEYSAVLKYAEQNDYINLPPETYDLNVTGYLGAQKSKPAAKAAISNIAVASGERISVTVNMRCIIKGTEKGTYTWDIDVDEITGDITHATMTIYDMDDTEVAYEIMKDPVKPDWVHGSKVNLDPGEYILKFEITVDDNKRTFEHILHIYQNLNTVIEYKFTDDHFVITGTRIRPIITYENPPDYPPELDVTPTTYGTGTSVSTPITLSVSGTESVTITVSNAANPAESTIDVPYSAIKWYWNGSEVTADATPEAVAGDKLTITADVAPFNVVTNQPWQLSVTGTLDGKEYSTEIWIKVVN